jgi:hypothetical protein
MGKISDNLPNIYARDTQGKEFRFPDLTVESREAKLDFTNDGTVYSVGDPWDLAPKLSTGFEVQHRLNYEKLQNLSKPLITESAKEDSKHRYNSQQVLKKALSDEYSRIEKSMHHSLEKISNYFQIQLNRVKKLFTKELNKAGIQKVHFKTDPSIHRFGIIA